VTGTLLAAVIFAIAAPVAIGLYHKSLTDSAWNTVTGAANQVAARLKSAEQVPDPIPRIRVLDARGHVVTGDPASAVGSALYRLPPGRSSERAVVVHPAFMTAGSAAVYAVRTVTPRGPETVVAAFSMDPASTRTRQVAVLTAGWPRSRWGWWRRCPG